MSIININWLSHQSDCEDCGISVADGAEVFLNGKCILSLLPQAACFDSTDYSRADVYKAILEELGYTLNEQE